MSESEDSSSSAEVDAKDRKIDSSVGSSEAIDPELDIRSEQFNPLKALYASSIQMPVENTPLFNNLAQYESALKRQDSAISSMSTIVAPKMPTKVKREDIELPQRRFLPHQEMVKGKGKSARQTRNLLLKMSSDQLMGPINILKQWKDQRKRVKIFTRNVTTINGYVTGFIEAFDKHWNIVLCDVFEVWKRKKFHYCPKAVMLHDHDDDDNSNGNNNGGGGGGDGVAAVSMDAIDELTSVCMQRLHALNITMPTMVVKSMSRKLVECSRNVPKLLIRGEQIATIILDTAQTIKPETEITFSNPM